MENEPRPRAGDEAPPLGERADGEDEGPDTNLGRVLGGRYRIDGFISGGGMGRVYRATQLQLDRPVAIKVLHTRLVRQGDPVFIQRFTLEAATSAKLSHPNIITVHDYGEQDGQLYMAMEYIEGEPLSKTVHDSGPFPVLRALHVALQVASGLRAAHDSGVVHRDLKPENVMVLKKRDEDGRDVIKILDFGLVKLLEGAESDEAAKPRKLELTGMGSMLGSPRYMAPEQINNGPVDARTDIYALGGVLYFMVAGHPSFDGPNLIEILHKHLSSPPEPIARCPKSLMDVILKCLEKKPEDRYPSLVELIRDLKLAGRLITGESIDFASMPSAPAWVTAELRQNLDTRPFVAADDVLGGTMASTNASEATARPPSRQKLIFALIGTAVLATVATGYLLLMPSSRPPSEARQETVAPILASVLEGSKNAATPILRLSSSPQGATVIEKGRALGQTPLSIMMVPGESAPRALRLELAGYTPKMVSQAPVTSDAEVTIALEPAPPPTPPESGALDHAPELDRSPARKITRPKSPARSAPKTEPATVDTAPDIRLGR